MKEPEREQMLRALNREGDWKALRWDAMAKAKWDKGGPTPAPVEEYRAAQAAFRARLVELAEEWVSSGWRDGNEYPRERTLRPGAGAHTALLQWDRENKPQTFRAQTGELRILPRSQKSAQPPELHDNPVERMRQEAVGRFSALMNAAPLKFQLSKCYKCGDYYFRKKLRDFYKGGKFFCSGCRKKKATVGLFRQERHDKLIEEAALALKAWQALSDATHVKHKAVKVYIARSLKKSGVGQNWVTRHMVEIQQFKSDQGIVG
jgi:hypothetical protein